ncbi:MAG: hypothetical protein ABL869_13790 [Candidatus Nitrotoga sp.]
MKKSIAFLAILASTSLSAIAETSTILHKDGSQTRVTTDNRGDHLIQKSTGGGGQSGYGVSHQDVVNQHKDPGDKVNNNKK